MISHLAKKLMKTIVFSKFQSPDKILALIPACNYSLVTQSANSSRAGAVGVWIAPSRKIDKDRFKIELKRLMCLYKTVANIPRLTKDGSESYLEPRIDDYRDLNILLFCYFVILFSC